MSFLIHLRVALLAGLLGSTTLATHAQTTPAKAATAPKARPAASQAAPIKSTTAKPVPARTATQPALPPVGGIKPEDRARQMTTSMTQALGLAATQVERVQAINLLSVQRVEEARRTYARKLKRMHAEIDLIGNSRLSLLKDVLTEQQFKAYAAMREKKMGIPEALKQQATMSEAASGE